MFRLFFSTILVFLICGSSFAGLFDPPTKVQIAQFKLTCRKLVHFARNDDEIPIWKFQRDPVEYSGTNIQFRARVVKVWEKNRFTWIKVDLSDSKDFAIVNIAGSKKIPIGKIIQVYGMGEGKTELDTAYGVWVYVPEVAAVELHLVGATDSLKLND